MAIYQETSFWGRWEKEKELKPGKKVLLKFVFDEKALAAANGLMGYVPISGAERLVVESFRTVRHDVYNAAAPRKQHSEFISGENINERDLQKGGFVSLLGIKRRVVYKI